MGIFRNIFEKIDEMRQQGKDKKEFIDVLLKAAEDGKLSNDEMTEIQKRIKDLGFTHNDFKEVKVKVYNVALQAIKADGAVTEDELKELWNLQNYLEIPESDIENTKEELTRLRLLTEIKNGNPPTITTQNVILQKKEVAYWSESGKLLEERVTKRRYVGGSQGISFQITKGVSYRLGSHRGNIISDKEIIPISDGDLIITNHRVIFHGEVKSFNIKYEKLLGVTLFSNGIKLTENNGKPRVVKINNEPNIDFVGAILAHAVNNFTV